MNTVNQKFLDLLQILKGLGMREYELDEITFAYDIAYHAHLGQKRDTGEDYINHPVEGCLLMAKDYGISVASLHIAFLLHDVGEDTTIFGDRNTLPWMKFVSICTNRVTRLFGPRVAELVVTLTKPGPIDGGWETKDELMKIYLAKLGKDQEAILLKMIDRLHNLRSLPANNPRKVENQVQETTNLLFPVFKSGIESGRSASDTTSFIMSAIAKDIQVQVAKLRRQK